MPNKNKFVKPVELPLVVVPFIIEDFSYTLQFKQTNEKMLVDWNLPKEGRKLELSFSTEISDVEVYKTIHYNWFGKNFIKTHILDNDNLEKLDELLACLKLSKLLFDFIIFEATISFVDPRDNFFSELIYYHGYGLTVNGRKYLEDVVIGE